jgi:hypothetical protein
MASGGSGATYRLNIDLGISFTSAGYESSGQSVALRLAPFGNDLASERFLENGRVQLDALAETLRGIVVIAKQQLGELPASVRVTYPAAWESRQLLQLWEALVLAGIPDAVTQPAAEPKLSVAVPPGEADTGQLPSDVPTQLAAPPPLTTAPPQGRSTRRSRPGLLIGAAILSVIAGVSAGAITTGVLPDAGTPEAVEPESGSSSAAGEPPARASSGLGASLCGRPERWIDLHTRNQWSISACAIDQSQGWQRCRSILVTGWQHDRLPASGGRKQLRRVRDALRWVGRTAGCHWSGCRRETRLVSRRQPNDDHLQS